MGYSKMELRNKNNPLLLRIQRQLDQKIKLKEFSDKKSKEKSKICLEDLDEDYKILSKVRKTRLGLHSKRGNSKW